jgi:hypothetical protein
MSVDWPWKPDVGWWMAEVGVQWDERLAALERQFAGPKTPA